MNHRKVLIFILAFVLFGTFSGIKTKAATSYITQTTNRYGDLVETQAAYEAVTKIKSVNTDIGKISFSQPKDLFIDSEDYLYIVDSGNKRVVILDENNEYITDFGEGILNQPRGIYVRDNLIYIADYGLIDDNNSGRIFIFTFDKDLKEVNYLKEFGRPSSIVLEIDNFIYRPEKIAVDANLTMYIVVEGSYNGILLVDSQNRFMSYFAPNAVSTTWKEKIIRFFYGENEETNLKKNLPAPPTNVFLDDSGYIYTVTKSIIQNNLGDTLKKVNVGGINFYPASLYATSDFISVCTGNVGNVYALSQSGFIYEYDLEGNILFIFAGKTAGVDQLGLFNSVSAIATNSKGNLFVLDDNDGSFQIFNPTNFVSMIHTALSYYNNGQYLEAKIYWEEVLRYNSMFDLAHKGIGMAHFLENDFEAARDKFELANAKEEYSEAFWEIRNIWLTNNLGTVLLITLLLSVVLIAFSVLKKKTDIFKPISLRIKKIFKKKVFADFFLFFRFIRHPYDTTYLLKTDKSIKVYNGFIFLFLLFGIYILSLTSTGFLFNWVIIEDTILLKETFKIIIPVFAFIIANYLTSSLLEGEGRLQSIFMVTIASLAPIVILFPLVIIISNLITYNESFIYDFSLAISLGWTFILLFLMNKELHNYSVKRNILNFLVTILLMIVLVIVVFLLYLIIVQVFAFISDLITEVIFRD